MRMMLMLLTSASIMLAVLGCTSNTTADKDKVYDINGKVVSMDAENKKVRLNHEDVPGLMKGMEMDFAVSDAKVLAGIKPGDTVHGRLKVKDSNYIITELHQR